MRDSTKDTERRPRLPTGNGDGPSRRTFMRPRIATLILGLLALNYLAVSVLAPAPEVVRIPYSPTFLEEVERGNVTRINATGETVTGELRTKIRRSGSEPADKFETQIPSFADEKVLEGLLLSKKVEISAEPITAQRNVFLSLLLGFGPILLLIGLFVFFAKRSKGGGMLSPLGGFGKAKPRRGEGETKVTFDDVAGIDEAKAELTEVVDFLKTPEKYQRLGGRIPRGVLLAGQPGTGKTLLAKAVAGQAGVPFFSMSASEFVEAIVGVGAARVRDLFRQAKEAAPAIIFIDELDAIGRSRSGGMTSGASDEREQTLNQILTEMDGFESDATVIVLGATNRPEILDSALMRPGRFDRRVVVPSPDRDGRRRILAVHTRSVPLDDDVELDRLAATTPGMVGADLANLCNEAALIAARRDHQKVHHDDFTTALEKIILGAPRAMLVSEEDRRRTAYHEAGHAIVGMLTSGADPVRKVSIIPRGISLGVTISTPDADRLNYDERGLLAKIDVSLGGRVAEELVFDSVTTGAESDIQQVTSIARAMVGRWGMSPEIGFVAALPSESQGLLLPGVDVVSEATQRVVDQEVKRLVDEGYARVTKLLSAERSRLDALAEALLDSETLDEVDAYAAAGVPPAGGAERPDPAVTGVPLSDGGVAPAVPSAAGTITPAAESLDRR